MRLTIATATIVTSLSIVVTAQTADTRDAKAVVPPKVTRVVSLHHPHFEMINDEETTTTTSVPETSGKVRPERTPVAGGTPARAESRQPASRPLAATSVWRCIGFYESGNNPTENTGNGYYGEFQFVAGTWINQMRELGLGYQSYPYAAAAPEAVQIEAAIHLQAESGWGQWPVTSRKCGV